MTDFFRDLLLKDFWLKLFSFVLAVLIWFTVWFALERQGSAHAVSPVPALGLTTTEQMTFVNLPVTILSSAEDTRSFKVVPKEVSITVQADSKTITSLQVKDVRALVDLAGSADDVRKRIEVSVPAGVTLIRVDPTEVQVVSPQRTDSQPQPAVTNSPKK